MGVKLIWKIDWKSWLQVGALIELHKLTQRNSTVIGYNFSNFSEVDVIAPEKSVRLSLLWCICTGVLQFWKASSRAACIKWKKCQGLGECVVGVVASTSSGATRRIINDSSSWVWLLLIHAGKNILWLRETWSTCRCLLSMIGCISSQDFGHLIPNFVQPLFSVCQDFLQNQPKYKICPDRLWTPKSRLCTVTSAKVQGLSWLWTP